MKKIFISLLMMITVACPFSVFAEDGDKEASETKCTKKHASEKPQEAKDEIDHEIELENR